MNKKILIYIDKESKVDEINNLVDTFPNAIFVGKNDDLIRVCEKKENIVNIVENNKLEEIINIFPMYEYLYMFYQNAKDSNYIIAHSSSKIEDFNRLLEVDIKNHLEVATVGIENNLQLMIGERARYLNRRYGLGDEYNANFNINPNIMLFNFEFNNSFFEDIVDFYYELLETGEQNINRMTSTAEIINLYIASMSIIHMNLDPKHETPFIEKPVVKEKNSLLKKAKRVARKIIK